MSTVVSQNNKGFSLIELLVSVSIFAIVITMAAGALIVLIDANAKAQNMQEAMTNMTFALDSITREARTGHGYYCSSTEFAGTLPETSTSDCTSGGTYFSVVEGGSSLTGTGVPRISFRYNDTTKAIDRRIGDGGWFRVTSDDVVIEEAIFYVKQTGQAGSGTNAKQAYVTVYAEGYAGKLKSTDTTFQLQATVVKRILDI